MSEVKLSRQLSDRLIRYENGAVPQSREEFQDLVWRNADAIIVALREKEARDELGNPVIEEAVSRFKVRLKDALRLDEPPSPSVVEAVDGEQHIVVRRGQLLALLQSYHHANGMNDEDALRAAKQGLVGMAVPAAPAA